MTAFTQEQATRKLADIDVRTKQAWEAYNWPQRYPEAESSLRFALSLDPQMQAAYYNLGLVLVAEKRQDEARAVFRRARQLAPDSPFGQAARERLRALGDGG